MPRFAADCVALQAALVPAHSAAPAIVPSRCCGWSSDCLAVSCELDPRSGLYAISKIVSIDYQEGVCPPMRLTEHIGGLSQLSILDLSRSSLVGSIPENIGQLRQLTYLNLEGNKLSGPIPDSIGMLSNLVTLKLNGNELDGDTPSSLKLLPNFVDSPTPTPSSGPAAFYFHERALTTTTAAASPAASPAAASPSASPAVASSPAASPPATLVQNVQSMTNALVSCFIVLAFVLGATIAAIFHFRKHELPRLLELHRQHRVANMQHHDQEALHPLSEEGKAEANTTK